MKIKHLLASTLLVPGVCWATVQSDAAAPDNCVDVAIFSINDFHGAMVPNPSKGLPGAAGLLQTLDSLKGVYPYHLVVTAGDNFGGSFFYKATRDSSLLPQLFHDMGITLSAIGNHEFDDGQDALARKWTDTHRMPAGWSLQYVCANCRDTGGKIPPYITPCAADSVTLPGGRYVKVGFIGLLTSNTPQQASKRNLKGLTFDGDYPRVVDSLRHSPGFRPVADADIRILLTHIGTRSENGQPVWEDKDMAHLYALKDTTFQAVISGHSHQLVCGNINNGQYPIVQGKSHGTYIGCLKFRIDTTTMKIKTIVPMTFRVTPKRQLEGKALRLQEQIERQLRQTCTPAGVPIGTRLTTAKNDIPHDRDRKHRLFAIGKWVCTAYAECARKAAGLSPSDKVVGVSHIGSIRTGFNKGPVTVLDVGEVLPFANNIRLFKVNGALLKQLVEYGLHNEKYGYIQVGNLEVERNADGHLKALYYTAGHHARTLLQDHDVCYLAADEFMTNGGDGYRTEHFPASQEIKGLNMPQTTDAFIHYLRTLPYIEEP